MYVLKLLFLINMKAYGLPREKNLEYPDVVDIQHYALKSSRGRCKTDRDYKSYTRSAKNRGLTRRYWKRKERALAKNNIAKCLLLNDD